jgi:hypothetical protein
MSTTEDRTSGGRMASVKHLVWGSRTSAVPYPTVSVRRHGGTR